MLLTVFLCCALPFLLFGPVFAETDPGPMVLSSAVESASLADAVDNASLAFETGGDANWFSQNIRRFYGGDAAQSGDIGDSQESWMKTTVTGPGTIGFFWKASSQFGGDFLEFYIDGARKDYISGNIPWTQEIYLVGRGAHTLKWRYVKNATISSGIDAGWVDKVKWTTYTVAPAVPLPPTGVSASDGVYTNKVRVTWRAVTGATSYQIYRSASPGSARLFLATRAGTSYDDTSALCDTQYYYWVRAKNAVGTSGYSNYNSGYIQFRAPTGVSASDGNFPDKIEVMWNPSADATTYEVYRASSLEGEKAKIFTTSDTIYDDTSIPCCTDFYYWVKAMNSKCVTGFSDPDSGHLQPPPPSPPTGVSASDGTSASQVRITWNASLGADIYEVYRALMPTAAKTLIASTSNTSWDDKNVSCGIFYYWVKAKGSAGTSNFSNSDPGYAILCPPPAPPTGVSASDGTFTDKIRITWNPSANATAYDIYRADFSGGEKIKVGTSSTTSFDDHSVGVGRSYCYWVKALKSTTASDFSLNFDTGFRMCPAPPAGVSASDDAYVDRIRVTWTASPGAVSYELYRAIFPTATDDSKTLLTTTSATSYDDFLPLCASSCSTCYGSNAKYYYWVKAKSADCTSNYSGTDSGYIHCSPSAPTGVTASGTLPNVIQITWNVSGAENLFEVYRATSLDGTKTLLATTPYSIYVDKSATCPTTYYYWVKRKDAKGFTSDFSNYDAGYCPGY